MATKFIFIFLIIALPFYGCNSSNFSHNDFDLFAKTYNKFLDTNCNEKKDFYLFKTVILNKITLNLYKPILTSNKLESLLSISDEAKKSFLIPFFNNSQKEYWSNDKFFKHEIETALKSFNNEDSLFRKPKIIVNEIMISIFNSRKLVDSDSLISDFKNINYEFNKFIFKEKILIDSYWDKQNNRVYTITYKDLNKKIEGYNFFVFCLNSNTNYDLKK